MTRFILLSEGSTPLDIKFKNNQMEVIKKLRQKSSLYHYLYDQHINDEQMVSKNRLNS